MIERLVIPTSHDPRRGRVPLGNDPRVVATHEAGHAVAGVILGQPVVLITPRLTTYRAQRRSARECYHAAVVAVGGTWQVIRGYT